MPSGGEMTRLYAPGFAGNPLVRPRRFVSMHSLFSIILDNIILYKLNETLANLTQISQFSPGYPPGPE